MFFFFLSLLLNSPPFSACSVLTSAVVGIHIAHFYPALRDGKSTLPIFPSLFDSLTPTTTPLPERARSTPSTLHPTTL